MECLRSGGKNNVWTVDTWTDEKQIWQKIRTKIRDCDRKDGIEQMPQTENCFVNKCYGPFEVK